MKQLRTAGEMRAWSRQCRHGGGSVGFVPTMGYLHEGHLSLIDLVKRHADRVVVSIFVNPTQFAPNEDLDAYPRDMERDLALCEERDVDAVYLPSADEVYPPGFQTWVTVEELTRPMEGKDRPTHFRGVTTVVSKLFHVVEPDVAAFGRKDAQQARVVQRMVRDMQFPVEILIGDIVREPDGLAMSSRNVNLTAEHRAQAPALHEGLEEAVRRFRDGERNAEVLVGAVREHIAERAPAGEINYVHLVSWETLLPVSRVEQTALLALAVRFGRVRLIDNTILETA